MKLRFGLTALCLGAAALSGAVDFYNLFKLPDHGHGGRGRHILSFGRQTAMAVGYVDEASGVHVAVAWPEITDSGPGPLVLLPTPSSGSASTAGSSIRLGDGRNVVVGQWTDPSGMRRSSIWINSTAMPLSYTGMALPQVPSSTGSEAHDILNLPGGGLVVVGHDWPVVNGDIKWIASVWRIAPNGQIEETLLPTPAGTGWSKALSIGLDPSRPGAVAIVGSTQESAGGPWRACAWRFNPATGQSAFRFLGTGPNESYIYRINPMGTHSVGWLERPDGTELSSRWVMRQGFPQINLQRQGRLYGISDRGYFAGTQTFESGMLDGLIGNVASKQDPFDLSILVRDWGGLTAADHLYCIATDGQIAGCTTIVPGVSYMPIAGVPTGEHGPDMYEVQRGQELGAPTSGALLKTDSETLDVRAQQGRVVLDTAILSAPMLFGGATLTTTLAGVGDGTFGQIMVFNWSTDEFEPVGQPFAWRVNETVTNWATFPSDYRSSTGEIRFRVVIQTPGRRDVAHFNSMTFKTN